MNITQITGIKKGSRDRIRELIRIRDNHTCQICKKIWIKGKRRFDVHHMNESQEGRSNKKGICDIDRKNMNEMITYCHKCHLNLPHIKIKINANKKIMPNWKYIKKIHTLRKEGATLKEIGLKCGVSHQAIGYIIKKYAVDNSPL